MPKVYETIQTPDTIGTNEVVVYDLTTTPWGGSPSSPTVELYTYIDGVETDVSLTNLTGLPSVLGDVITCPGIHSITEDVNYHLYIRWVNSGNTVEAVHRFKGRR